MATESKSKANNGNKDSKKRKQRYLPHNKSVKKGGYPLRPGVQGFFITCDGGRERQASYEAMNVLDSFYEELVHGTDSDINTKLPNKPQNKKTKFTYSDSDSDEDDVNGQKVEDGDKDKSDTDRGSEANHKSFRQEISNSHEVESLSCENRIIGDNDDGKEDDKYNETQEVEAEALPAKKQCLEPNASKSGRGICYKTEEKSIDKLIEAELEELKDKSKRRFIYLDSGCNGVVFVQMLKKDGDPSPKDIAQHMIESIAKTRKHMSRFILRVLPVEVSCYASEEEISRAIKPLIEQHFPVETQTPHKFAVLYEARANTGVERMKIINTVAKSVPGPHKVDLNNPDKNIVVQIARVLKECHGVLDRHWLMLEACEQNSVSEEDYIDLGKAGLGSCLLGGLPDWLIAYSARLVRFINSERIKLPKEILSHNLEEKRKYFAEICMDVEKSDAEVQAEGVYNQRLQNLALTLDKVRYVLRCVFGDPKQAPPPLERLSPEEVVSFIWKGEGSLVDELLQCMAPHMEDGPLNDLKSSIRAHDPSGSNDIQMELRKSLIWLRDEVRNLPCTYKCRHDAAADLIHIYAFTKFYFRIREYKAVTSPPVLISPLDLGPKYSDKLGSGFHEYCKTYGENYCLGQLIYWHNQTNAEPDCSLANASRGCLSLPDIGSFYAKVQKPSKQRIYGPRTLKFMLSRMVKQPQRPWPKDRIWSFENSPKIFGSPMLDAVLHNAPLDKELVHWLKHRPPIFHATWDR